MKIQQQTVKKLASQSWTEQGTKQLQFERLVGWITYPQNERGIKLSVELTCYIIISIYFDF